MSNISQTALSNGDHWEDVYIASKHAKAMRDDPFAIQSERDRAMEQYHFALQTAIDIDEELTDKVERRKGATK